MENEKNTCQCQCQSRHTEDDVQKADTHCTVVKEIWRNFLLETSFHGCRNIGERRPRSVLYRLIWAAAVLAMFGSLIKLLTQSYAHYHEYRITTSSSIEVLQQMPFPAITVCSASMFNTYENNNISQTIKNLFGKGTLLKDYVPSVNLSHPDFEMTMKELLDNYSVPAERLIPYHAWMGSGNITFQPVITSEGKCYMAKGSTQQAMAIKEGRAGGLQMILNIEENGIIMQGDMTYGARIFVHDPKGIAGTDQGGVMVAPGNSMYIRLKPTKYKFLPAPYKSYGDSYCVETDDTYSDEVCVMKWISTQTAVYCNCTSEYGLSDILKELPSCSLKQFVSCYVGAYEGFQQQSMMKNFSLCPKPCSFTRYETSVSFTSFPTVASAETMINFTRTVSYPKADFDYIRRSVIKVTIYFDKFFLDRVVYEPQVTLDSISSSVGGQMGLFLGASLLTVAELGQTVLYSFFTLWRRLLNMRKKTQVISLHKS